MAEAIISRATIGEFIDPTKCIFNLSLKTSTGNGIAGMKVLMNDAGTESNLISDENGMIYAQPISGYANIKIGNVFENGVIIVDQYLDSEWYNFEAKLGKKVNGKINYLGIEEGTQINLINGNYTFFAANSIDINMSGGGGGGGGFSYPDGDWCPGQRGGFGYTYIGTLNIQKYTVYNSYIGKGGSGGANGGKSGSAGETTIFGNICANGGSGGGGGYMDSPYNDAAGWSKPASGGNGAGGGTGGRSPHENYGKKGDNGWSIISLHY